ncbi:PIN-like domain-containing protein [Sphaerisporangium album]|uniref:PIN-like domain-containing protein n=1 Tax=Sphaerisporangium album TaxID=509200 RepID=UPI0011C07A5A|nr:PIN-like domain-containing protein [Sphaerisporangium album]
MKTVLTGGLVALDANVLLNLYRYLPSAREELFGVLEKLKSNLWVPHQVGLEFSRRRHAAIRDHESTFDTLSTHLDSSLQATITQINTFANRVSLDPLTKKHITSRLEEVFEGVRVAIERIKPDIQKLGAGTREDPVIKRLDLLLEDKVGPALVGKDLELAVVEAARRAELNIPPGYKDKGKDDSRGDYLLWHQLIIEASSRGTPVLLVTDDVKEDWWRKDYGRTLGPRPELYEEMIEKAGVPFLMMTTSNFLRNTNVYLNAAVSVATIEAAQEVVANQSERGSFSISHEIELLISRLEADESHPGGRGTIQHIVFAREVNALLRELPAAKLERLRDGATFIFELSDGRPVLIISKFFDTSTPETFRSQLRRFVERKLRRLTSDSFVGVLIITNVEIPSMMWTELDPDIKGVDVVVWDGDSKGTLDIVAALREIAQR